MEAYLAGKGPEGDKYLKDYIGLMDTAMAGCGDIKDEVGAIFKELAEQEKRPDWDKEK